MHTHIITMLFSLTTVFVCNKNQACLCINNIKVPYLLAFKNKNHKKQSNYLLLSICLSSPTNLYSTLKMYFIFEAIEDAATKNL